MSLRCNFAPNAETAKPAAASLAARGAMPAATLALAITGSLHAAPEMASENAEGATIELPKMTVEEQRRAVSSPKFTVPLVDTPQTISVITADIFNAQGATNLSDVLRNTPGITFAAGEGGNVASGDAFFMRGFDASNSIFVDGVRDTGAYNRDTYNLEQVEIAKGPAGADTGRGGSSGYINLSTKVPHLGNDVGGQLVYGAAEDGDPQQRATLDVNRQLTPNTAVRVAALWQDSGVPGREHVSNSSIGISPSLAVGLGGNTQFTLSATYDKMENVPDSGLPIVALPDVELVGGTPLDVDQSNYYGLGNGQDYEDIERTSLTARIGHDFTGVLRLVNQTKWIATDRDSVTSYFQNSAITPATFPPATTPVNPATGAPPADYTTWVPATGTVTPRRIHTQTDNEILSNQTNLATQFSTGSVHHSASTGVELMREEQTVPAWSPTGSVATSITEPDLNRVATVAQTPYLAANNPYAHGKIDTVALYAFDTMQFSPRFLVNASLRLERYTVESESLAAATPSAPSPARVKISDGDDLFSWKAGVVFKPRANGSLYAAIANTFTPPGASFTLSSANGNQNNPNLEPLESMNYELGVKWEFLNSRLSTNLALYRSDNYNFTSTDAITGLPTQDISQNVQGIEFGISGKITNDWLIFGGFGYIDSEYEADGTTSAPNDGANLRFTPRLSGNLWTTYAIARKWTIGGGVQYTDNVLRSTSNTQVPTAVSIPDIPDYWIVNLMAAYAVNEHLALRVNVNNVFDEYYYRLNNNGGRYYPGTPRSVLVTADWKF
jgi:catecholate siderophore receptor